MSDTESINVPQGGMANAIFNLHISDDGQEWTLTYGNNSNPINKGNVIFNRNSTSEQRQFERCTLVAVIANQPSRTYDWRFTLNGIQYSQGRIDKYNDIQIDISQDGKVLTLTIHDYSGANSDNAAGLQEIVDFSFIGLRKNLSTNECIIFESKDPKIGIGRGGQG